MTAAKMPIPVYPPPRRPLRMSREAMHGRKPQLDLREADLSPTASSFWFESRTAPLKTFS